MTGLPLHMFLYVIVLSWKCEAAVVNLTALMGMAGLFRDLELYQIAVMVRKR